MQPAHQKRIGIFRGTFDPLHEGHLAFAKAAIKAANLSYVYFLPENSPKHKTPAQDFENRLIAIKEKINPYKRLEILKLPEMNGSIRLILPDILKRFGDSKLVFLMGSDVAKTINQWADANYLCQGNELIIGTRDGENRQQIEAMLEGLYVKPSRTIIINSPMPSITSSHIRQRAGQG